MSKEQQNEFASRKRTRSHLRGLPAALILAASVFPAISLSADAAYSSCYNETHYGWSMDVGFSGTGTYAGFVVKDMIEDSQYLVKFANVPWIDLDQDSSVLDVYLSSAQVSCSEQDYPSISTYCVTTTFTPASGSDDGYSNNFAIGVCFFEDSASILIDVSAGSTTFQQHPVYWHLAPCHNCGSADPGDEYLAVDASGGSGTTNIAEQHRETQWDEMVYRNWVYKVFDATTWAFQMEFWAYNYTVSGPQYRTWAWALKCTSCTETAGSQYSVGPWDNQNNDVIWDEEVQLVIIHQRNSGSSGAWTSGNSLRL